MAHYQDLRGHSRSSFFTSQSVSDSLSLVVPELGAAGVAGSEEPGLAGVGGQGHHRCVVGPEHNLQGTERQLVEQSALGKGSGNERQLVEQLATRSQLLKATLHPAYVAIQSRTAILGVSLIKSIS